jgi:signal transduction histidine kinase
MRVVSGDNLGAHMSIAGGLPFALVRGRDLGCGIVQLFLKNQVQWVGRSLGADEVAEFKRQQAATGIRTVFAHAPYLINLASPEETEWLRSVSAFHDELERAELLGLPFVVIHPGSHKGAGREAGLARIVRAIDDLVERLRVLSSPVKPLGPLDLRGPIEETLELLQARLEDRRISVARTYDERRPAVMGEPDQLKQLFLNLFLNSLEAMEPGGTLTIRLKMQEGAGDSVLVVEVADTGCGIPEGLSENIFDTFFSTKPQGTGLGLVICRGITDAHRATIRAANNPTGGGATISLTFPAAVGIAAEVHG